MQGSLLLALAPSFESEERNKEVQTNEKIIGILFSTDNVPGIISLQQPQEVDNIISLSKVRKQVQEVKPRAQSHSAAKWLHWGLK